MNQASLYQRANSMQRHDASQILAEYANVIQWRLDGRDTLLDVGCGSGDVLMDFVYPRLPKDFKQVVGTDISAKMVAYARKCYAEYDRTKFQVFDIGSELLPKHLRGSFDHVTSFYCLHWVQNHRQALQNIYQLLRHTGGDCLLVFLANNPIFDVYQVLAKLPKWCNYMQDFEQFISPLHNSADPSAEFRQMLQAAGFVDYNVEIRDQVYVYDSVATARDNVKAVCPFLERIPSSLHEEFIDDIFRVVVSIKKCEKVEHETDFKIISPYRLVVAYARKRGGFIDSVVATSNAEKSVN